jgi:hypothetical protein
VTPATIAGALAQVLLGLTAGWIVAGAALEWAGREGHSAPESGPGGAVGWPERALFAVIGFVALAVLLMIGHLVTMGAVFGEPFLVPAVGLALVAVGCARGRLPSGIPWLRLALFAVLLIAIYEVPVLLEGSGVRAGDASFHMGWTQELLGGDPMPSGPAPAFGRNAYPWGFHAVMATMVRLVPGTTTLVAEEALQLVMLLGIPVAGACLARRVSPEAGWLGAGAAALIGGFGWLVARGWTFIASPSEARFGADLVVASPNSVYELFPPAFPRELGVVVLAAAGVLIVLAARPGHGRHAVMAGVVTGLVGLISAPLFGSALLWAAGGALLAPRGARVRTLAAILAPALVIFGLWFGPVVASYIELGGFVNVTPQLGAEWPLPVALASWGLLLPAALGGVWLSWRRGGQSARVLLAFAAATIGMLGAAKARAALDWNLGGNATFLHQGRVWPAAHLLGAAFAGVALTAAYSWLEERSRTAAACAVAAVMVVGAASPVLASGGLTRILAAHDHGFVYDTPSFESHSFVIRAARVLEPDDIVETVPGRGSSNSLGFWLFQFSGCSIANYDDQRLARNDLRIRYRELADAWDARMAEGGFVPDYIALKVSDTLRTDPRLAGRIVAAGDFLGAEWVLVEAH